MDFENEIYAEVEAAFFDFMSSNGIAYFAVSRDKDGCLAVLAMFEDASKNKAFTINSGEEWEDFIRKLNS